MSGASLTSRENEILRILEIIYSNRQKFALIGGYAVDAYSPLPRYSVDCDIVISKSDFDEFSKLLIQNGFQDKSQIYRNELEGIETWKFKKLVNNETASIELFLDGVRCRETRAIWAQEEIISSSTNRRVVGVSRSVTSNVVSKELLIAMKLHSGRDADLRDAIMLMDSVDWNLIAILSNRGTKQKVIDQLESALDRVERPEFENELRASFASKQSEDSRIRKALENINQLLKKMADPHTSNAVSAKL